MSGVELHKALCIGLSSESGIPYTMYEYMIDILYRLSKPLAEDIHNRVIFADNIAFI